MNRFIQNSIIVVSALVFTSCANIEMGFEEDSPFYSAPNKEIIEAREDSQFTKNVINRKHDKLSTINIRKTNNNEENETTFYYEFVEE